jgi:hypothetical protein
LRGGIRVREKSNFVKRFNADSTVQSLRKKYFASIFQKFVIFSRGPAPAGGALRDRHGRWARDAMDVSGRSACAQTNDADADVKSCGPGLPTLRLSWRMMIRRRWGQQSPVPRESTI